MDSFRSWTKNSRMVEAQYRICIFCFCSPRISPKENGWSKRRIPPQTPPPPLAKSESSRGFAETISPENCFRKTESAFRSATLPETLRAEPQRKMSFPFSRKNSPPRKICKEHFSLGLPSEARQWRDDSFVVRIISKIHSNFV